MTRAEAAAVLGISPTASEGEARKAYLSRARLLHPDRLAGVAAEEVKAATAAMAQLNDAYAAFKKAGAPTESPTASGTSTDAFDRASFPREPACSLCGYMPAAKVKFNSVAGLVLFWQWRTTEAYFCRRCGEAMYNEAQASTLLKGWWGIVAPVATIVAFVANAGRVFAVRRLEEPSTRSSGAYSLLSQPIRFSRPWFTRPASMLASILALTIIGFVVVGLVSTSGAPTSVVKPTVVGSCWREVSDGTLGKVECSDDRAAYRVYMSVADPSGCIDGYFAESDGTFSCLEPVASRQ